MILCIGDYINDIYVFGRASRICPEAPVPVVIPERERSSAGGVGLVHAQLVELGADSQLWMGSWSTKRRVFAGNQLVCRIDNDGEQLEPAPFPDAALRECDAVIVSDYGKGGMIEEIADELKRAQKWLFVDAKHHWDWYASHYTYFFPNEHEVSEVPEFSGQIVQKRGARGCKWGELEFPATTSDVVDVTGAGDIFIAAFTYATICERLIPSDCLEFANTLAGESCRHRGTYVVPKASAQEVLDRLRPSEESAPQSHDPSDRSIALRRSRWLQDDDFVAEESGAYRCGIQIPDSWKELTAQGEILKTLDSWQTPRILPLDPTESSDVQFRAAANSDSDDSAQPARTGQNPNDSGNQCEHTRELDQHSIQTLLERLI